MSGHELDDEMQEMFEHQNRIPKTLSNETIGQPIKALELTPPPVVDMATTVEQAVALMQQRKIGCVLVVREGVLTGIFTERDVLLKMLNKKVDYVKAKVKDYMTSSPEVLHVDDSIAYAMNLMSVGGYRHIPIVDAQRRPLSVLSMKDVVSYIVEHFPDEILNLPPKPLRSTSEREGA